MIYPGTIADKINNVGELIDYLKDNFHTSTPINLTYIDIKNEPHTRALFKSNIKLNNGVCAINQTY